MARKKSESKRKSAANGTEMEQASVTDTPLWDRYYKELRKRIRFPRHYKKSMNW